MTITYIYTFQWLLTKKKKTNNSLELRIDIYFDKNTQHTYDLS